MVADELARLEDITEETLAWTRPNFLELSYELSAPTGVVVRVNVEGIGPERRIRAATANVVWTIDAFPLDRLESPIVEAGEDETVAIYVREQPPCLSFVQGPVFRYRIESAECLVCETLDGKAVFTVERAEFFPLWRWELKLGGEALAVPELPLLLACTCCVLFFS